jgi:hypothetical protein
MGKTFEQKKEVGEQRSHGNKLSVAITASNTGRPPNLRRFSVFDSFRNDNGGAVAANLSLL